MLNKMRLSLFYNLFLVVAIVILLSGCSPDQDNPKPSTGCIIPGEYLLTEPTVEDSDYLNINGLDCFSITARPVLTNSWDPLKNIILWKNLSNTINLDLTHAYDEYMKTINPDASCLVVTAVIDGPIVLSCEDSLYGEEPKANLSKYITAMTSTGGWHYRGSSFVGSMEEEYGKAKTDSVLQVGDYLPLRMKFVNIIVPDFKRDYKFYLEIPVRRLMYLEWIENGQPESGPEEIRDTLRTEFKIKARK